MPSLLSSSAMSDSDDDVPTLSAHTLAALQEFYNETRTGPDHSTGPADQFAVGAMEEDWVSVKAGETLHVFNFFAQFYPQFSVGQSVQQSALVRDSRHV